MKSLKELINPRKSVFDKSKRDTVLDLTDINEKDKIKPSEFFEENFLTDGMKALYEGVFKRFEGKSDDGIFRLTQTMGGGKTHSMVATALLAKYPEYREKVMGRIYKTKFEGTAKVIAFSGRESDTKYGIWGYIAEQVGKKEQLNEYYSPLKAPGQTTWINLLKGEPLLILLDELPPYFENAMAIQVGNSNLATVTVTAITNLLMAVGKGELSNVCVVLSDLTAHYSEGRSMMTSVFNNLNSEVGRIAKDLTPVKPNSDELYLILRKRLFENEAPTEEIQLIADAYREAMKQAKQMDLTTESPEQFAANIASSYPFHPGIKDLFARFKENQGFQQTRGMIRLMRTFMSRMFDNDSGWSDRSYLIHAYDFDLNDQDTLTEIGNVNRDLINAITHDISNQGNGVAERIDAKLGSTVVGETARLILLSSLSTVTGGLRGLNEIDIVRNVVKPNRVPASIKNEVLIPLTTEAWYLHTDRDGQILFKDVKNVVAQLTTISSNYNEQSIKKDLIEYLRELFEPTLKDCYQQVYALPSLDEIQVFQDKVTLIIYTPHHSGGLNADLQKFYEDQTFKNRLMFLSGDNRSLAKVNENAAQLKAITYIIGDLTAQKVSTSSLEYIEAENLKQKIRFNFLSAVQQTFVKLWYPHSTGLKSDNFTMQFSGSSYKGEDQIRNTLKISMKFTENISDDNFKLQCEVKLFTQKNMPWNDIKKKAATEIKWQWHKPDALDQLKEDMLRKEFWRSDGSNWVEKGPFPPPVTDVRFQVMDRNAETGEVLLKITPVNGDTVYYEIGAVATTASGKIEDVKEFRTQEIELSFLCVDSAEKHGIGSPFTWRNEITLQYRIYDQGSKKMLQLQSAPNAPIRYTTDGSNPLNTGGTYAGPFEIPKGTSVVLAIAEKKGVQSQQLKVDILWSADPEKPLIDKVRPAQWKRRLNYTSTQDSYEFFKLMKKYKASIYVKNLAITGQKWVEINIDSKLGLEAEKLELVIDTLRTHVYGEGQVSVETLALQFPTGQMLEDYVHETKTDLNASEIEQ